MKNVLSYYYNLNPINIYQGKKKYKFMIDETEYCFIVYEYDLNLLPKIYELHNHIRQYNIYCHEIVLNNKMQIGTFVNNKYYILLKLSKLENQIINLKNILYYPFVTSNLKLNEYGSKKNWRELWIEKIDYFEYEVLNFKKKYPFINKISSYYIGLAEIGIQLMNNVSNIYDYCICHHRIKKEYKLFDLYNPLEFVVDSKVRDIAEFCKEKIFFDKIDLNEIFEVIDKVIINEKLAIMFFSRLLYPSYYLDVCEEIFYNNKNESVLDNIVTKNKDYEKFLKQILEYLQRKYYIQNIEWLKKN